MTVRLYRPPAPHPIGANAALFRSMLTLDRDLLALMPDVAYRVPAAKFGVSRRGIVLAADPALVRRIMIDDAEDFPKNDLMVDALAPLINDGLFVSSGDTWRRQRRMIDPAFSHIRVTNAFEKMQQAVDACEERLDRAAAANEPVSLDRIMTQLTADIVFRTIFSKTLDDALARDFFDAWARFQQSVANIRVSSLLFGKPWDPPPRSPTVRSSANIIRSHLTALVQERLQSSAGGLDDICQDILDARDPETGEGFSEEEIVDQVAVFFIAGHETTASVLTWAFFILSQQPDLVASLRREIDALVADGRPTFNAVKRMAQVRGTFLETMRLYPPLGFIPRVSLKDTAFGDIPVKRGSMVIISPWIVHRHEKHWPNADRFDPARFSGEAENRFTSGAYIPFGLGPRVCAGASFASMEAALVIARLVRRYDFESLAHEGVKPVCQLSVRPKRDIVAKVRRRPSTKSNKMDGQALTAAAE